MEKFLTKQYLGEKIEALKQALTKKGVNLEVKWSSPISESEIKQLEKELNCSFPPDYRTIINTIGADLTLNWFIGENTLPNNLSNFDFGGGIWETKVIKSSKERIENNCDPDDIQEQLVNIYSLEEEVKEHLERLKATHLLPFYHLTNGDLIVMEYNPSLPSYRIVYLDHDYFHSPIHSIYLAPSITDYIMKMLELGCPDPEYYTIKPFLTKKKGLDFNCSKAKQWKEWLYTK
jgi:SMI1 / KNR4 family (SUKH-1)